MPSAPEKSASASRSARISRIRHLVMRQGATLIVFGVGSGLVAAIGLSQVLTALLYGVGARDPLTFTGAGVLLAGVTVVACWLPARRAARVDPIVALRHD